MSGTGAVLGGTDDLPPEVRGGSRADRGNWQVESQTADKGATVHRKRERSIRCDI